MSDVLVPMVFNQMDGLVDGRGAIIARLNVRLIMYALYFRFGFIRFWSRRLLKHAIFASFVS